METDKCFFECLKVTLERRRKREGGKKEDRQKNDRREGKEGDWGKIK
jgi:hypothetical protein